MRTFYLDKQDIIKITGQRFYKRGYDYFKKGKVIGLTYNQTIDTWTAQVRGASNYTVRIFFFENDELEGKCNCPAYHTHFTCKHIAAVLLAIGQRGNQHVPETPQHNQINIEKQATSDPFTLRLLHTFNQTRKTHALEREALQIEYTVSQNKHSANKSDFLEIELRVGTTKTYIIKDIRTFLIHVKNEQPYPITNNFTYEPITHYFDQQDLNILQQLTVCYQNESLFEMDYPMTDKRTIKLAPNLALDLLKKISERHHVFMTASKQKVNHYDVNEHLPPLHFPIDMEGKTSFLINMKSLFQYTYFEQYGLLFKDNCFYPLTVEQQQIIDQIFALLPYRTQHVHRIAQEHMEAFVSHVLPQLSEIGTIDYTNKTTEVLEEHPLDTVIYLDEANDVLVATVVFHYGEHKLYPYENYERLDVIIKRDVEKEQHILRFLEHAGFYFLNGRFQLFNNESMYRFLHEKIPELQEIATIYFTHAGKALYSEKEPDLTTSIGLNKRLGMLDVSFDIEGISDDDIQLLLEAVVEKKRYVRLSDGPLVSLEKESFVSFQKFVEQLQLSKQDVLDGHVQVSAAKSFQLEEVFNEQLVHYDETFTQLIEALKQPEQLKFTLPDALKAELRDYQHVGFQWFKTLSFYQLGGILADDMGLGKTVQTISYLLSEKEEKIENYQALVIAPASLVYNWKKEIDKFAPTLRSKIVIGSKQQRKKLMAEQDDTDILITSYPLIRKDIELYEHVTFDALILDEAQAIKNHLTLTAKAVRAIKAKNRFALSGTPIENALDELWSIFEALTPGFLGSKKQFLQLDADYIATITRPFILRRLKEDVLNELPEKIETEQYAELTKLQKQVYLAYIEKMHTQLSETIATKGFEKGKLEILAGLTRLRQICCHPSLFLDNYHGKSGKLEHLRELVTDLRASGKRLLIFSQFSSMLQIIATTIEQEGYNFFYLDGSTPAEERVNMADAFNEGDKDVFLISLKAGGTGLNLTGADTVILFDLWWNPAIEAQAAGRAHRIGQKNVVQVIRLITEGTIEEKIYQLQKEKRALVDQIIQPGETMLSKLTESELRQLLSFER
ncbi:RNA polymerase-associated protein RapA [Paraliobacillus sp. PM-2]|uniref:DEAD/DEAH box helicase n=1 Tax=Paraliobacillus sp. PM-2 TaxID=1462524 RepID=UPI00061C815D|nr:DEAD/DEAH box helicase [Paraliobacillus sp. PM-2]CQR46464.1 RNA polymerase-associated protein RapA [Paraliobacillus sp. PM-2]